MPEVSAFSKNVHVAGKKAPKRSKKKRTLPNPEEKIRDREPRFGIVSFLAYNRRMRKLIFENPREPICLGGSFQKHKMQQVDPREPIADAYVSHFSNRLSKKEFEKRKYRSIR